jgi:alpha-tubulin suppressor-like RCC1 family protein
MHRFASVAVVMALAALSGLHACSSFSGDGGAPVPDEAAAEASDDAARIEASADASTCSGCAAGAACYEGVCDGAHPVSVSAGNTSACVVLKAGSVWCWGDNRRAQLGVTPESVGKCGLEACRSRAERVAGIDDAVEVAVGGYFACARKKDNSVWCWGSNAAGELGRATTGMCNGVACDPTPAPVASLPSVTQLSLGPDVACARTTTGRAVCWGEGRSGNLGFDDAGAPPVGPVEIQGLSGVAEVQLALAGEGVRGAGACARKDDGTVLCWGLNNGGELGHAPGTSGDVTCAAATCNPIPTPVPGAIGGVALAVGTQAACLARAVPNSAICWGRNADGQLGIGPPSFDATFINTTVNSAVGPRIAGRFTNYCVTNSTGSLVCWGTQFFGAQPARGGGNMVGYDAGPLGCPALPCQPTPSDIGVDQAEVVAAGRAFFVATKNDGSVVAWGANPDGRLGHAPGTLGDGTANTIFANSVVARVEGLP